MKNLNKTFSKILMVVLSLSMFPFNTVAYVLCNILRIKGRENMTSPVEWFVLLFYYLKEGGKANV